MKKWTSIEVSRLTEKLRAWADQRRIFIGIDSRRMVNDGSMIYICQDCDFASCRILVNFNEIDSIESVYHNITSHLEKELNTMGYRPMYHYTDGFDAIDFDGDCVRYCVADVAATTAIYNHLYPRFKIEKVIFNEPATIVIWSDGSKTVVKTQDGEPYDPEKGLAMAISKRALGDKGSYYDIFDTWLKTYKPKKEEKKEVDKEKIIITTASPLNPILKLNPVLGLLDTSVDPYFTEEFPLDTEEDKASPECNKNALYVCDNCESRFLENDDYPCTKCDDNFSHFVLRKDLRDIDGKTSETTPKN